MNFLVKSFVIAIVCSASFSAYGRNLTYPAEMITLSMIEHFHNDCLIIRGVTDFFENVETLKAFSTRLEKTTLVVTAEDPLVKRKGFRESCARPLIVLFGGEIHDRFAGFSDRESMSGEVWLIFLTGSTYSYFEGSWPPFDSQVFSANTANPSRVLLQEVYCVDHHHPLRLVDFGEWTPQNGLLVSNVPLPVRRHDLEGKILRVGWTENWPVSSFQGGEWGGYLPTIWLEICRVINCTAVPVRSIDNATGLKMYNGSWNGLMGMLIRREIDVIAAELTMTKSRLKYSKFCRPVFTAKYQIYFKARGYRLEWTFIFKPLSFEIWLVLCTWLLAGTICIYFFHNCYIRYGFEENSKLNFTATESFFFILQSLCQQGYHAVPSSISCRIIFFTAYLLSGIMIPSYSASLISALTSQIPVRPFDSLDGLVKHGKYKLYVRKNSASYMIFSQAADPLYKEVYEKAMQNMPESLRILDTSEAINSLCNTKYFSIFGIDKIINMKIKQSRPKCKILTLTKPLSPIFLSYALRKNSPYLNVINYHLQKLFTLGITSRLKYQYKWDKSDDRRLELKEVEVDEIANMFLLLVSGIIGAIFLVLMERKISGLKFRQGNSTDPTGFKRDLMLFVDFYVN